MVDGLTTTCAISAYHHLSCEFEPHSGEVYSIQHYVTGRLFSPGTPVSSTNKTPCHNVTEILLKVALSTVNLDLAYNYKNSVFMTTLWFSVGTLDNLHQ